MTNLARLPIKTGRDPLASTRAILETERAAQIRDLENALSATIQAAQAVSGADILHDERTRQLADQIAAVGRTLSLDLGQRVKS